MLDRHKFTVLFVPILIEQALSSLTAMFGTMMVSGVGAYAVSGVGLVDSINLVVVLVFNAIATGVTVAVSQCVGARDHVQAGRVAGQSLTALTGASALAGALLAVSGRAIIAFLFGGAESGVIEAANVYMIASAVSLPLQSLYAVSAGVMRATGNSRSPMYASLFANVTYIGTSLACILGLRMGVLGIGIGLIASRFVSSGTALAILLRGGGGVVLPRLTLKPDWKVLAPVMRIALPIGADSGLFNGGKIIVQVFMSGMGTATLAANAIANSLSVFLNLPGNAMSIACMTVIGQSYGTGDMKRTRSLMIRLTLISMGLFAVMGALMYPFLGSLISVYSPGAAAASIARSVFVLVLLASPFTWPSAFIMPNMLRAAGDVKYTMTVSIASMFLLRVAGAWFLGVYLKWGLPGIWLSMIIDWTGRMSFFIPRVLSGVWHRKSAVSGDAG